MGEIVFRVNGVRRKVDVDERTPLLWVLRDSLGLLGPKFGCGMGLCGCCTVHVDGEAVRSCQTPVIVAEDSEITTIEGLESEQGLHPLQKAWIDEQVAQCGYCQAGQIMQAAAFLKTHPDPKNEDIDLAMAGNLCRCGTYQRIRRAVKRAAKEMKS